MKTNMFLYNNADLHAHHSRDINPNPNDFCMHTHECFEIYYFISGDAYYTVEGSKYSLEKGDVLIMRSAEAHHLNINPGTPYERISLHFLPRTLRDWFPDLPILAPFTERPLGHNNKFSASDFRDNSYSLYIHKAVQECKNPEISRFSLISNLFSFLVELHDAYLLYPERHSTNTIQSTASRMIEYVNSHLFENITLKSIASKFFVSQVYANKLFKVATGTSIWNYVIKKRLLHAREAIKNGQSIQKVYTESGYQDYASFYRAYYRNFQCSPSSDKPQKVNPQ